MTDAPPQRSAVWKWWVCGLLLCASAINYLDRQALANAAHRITTQFQLSQEQYGNLELGFGYAFAGGSLFFGILVDRLAVRWLYPLVLVLWSATGFVTGLVQGYGELLVCRTLLGFFEAGHWPCAIKTTQRLLEPKDRSMGNSVLQSGASLGAIVTPLIMTALMTQELGSWRFAFQAIALVGVLWIVAWFATVREGELAGLPPQPAPEGQSGNPHDSAWKVILSRRMLVILVVVALINTCWQILRAWLPKFLQEGRGYSEEQALCFNSLYFVATDVGCLGAGALTLWLHRRGFAVHGARCATFAGCAVLCALTLVVAWLPKGWLLLAGLLVVGAGALGVFPIYHAFTQDLTRHHQGKVTGVAGVAAWALSPAQKYFGRLVDQTGSFDLGFALAGCLPLFAFVALYFFWGKTPELAVQRPATKR
jgi:ACS family hexuronate transporter-like MFS transporter